MTGMIERITRTLELRRAGRTLEGTVITWNEISPTHREQFVPGSMRWQHRQVWLDLQHDVRTVLAWTGGGGLELSETPTGLSMRALLPQTVPAAEAITLANSGELQGLSVEFIPESSHDQNGIRVVTSAELHGIGLVGRPGYPGSTVELRAAPFAKSRIPYGIKLPCDCHRSQNPDCKSVKFQSGAFDESIGQAVKGESDIIAISGPADNQNYLGSVKRGTLVLTAAENGLDVQLTGAAGNTQAGRALADAAKVGNVYARPLFDQDESTFTETENTAIYSKVMLRAVLVKTIVGDAGKWQPIEVTDKPAEKRRARVWY